MRRIKGNQGQSRQHDVNMPLRNSKKNGVHVLPSILRQITAKGPFAQSQRKRTLFIYLFCEYIMFSHNLK